MKIQCFAQQKHSTEAAEKIIYFTSLYVSRNNGVENIFFPLDETFQNDVPNSKQSVNSKKFKVLTI